jgi:hypothetical protein
LNCPRNFTVRAGMYVTYVDEDTHYSRWGGVPVLVRKREKTFPEKLQNFFLRLVTTWSPPGEKLLVDLECYKIDLH